MSKQFFHQRILRWWRDYGRVLPWREKVSSKYQIASIKGQTEIKKPSDSILQVTTVRETAFQNYFAGELRRDPYRVVVSEVMLQQTQVDRVIPKYEAWMKQWPSIQDLAQASLAEVVIAWQGLGYNRRARFLWLLAKEIAEVRDGVWPETEVELIQLPGIGKYTARALLSFCFGQQVGVVDTNVKRVLGRWLDIENNFRNHDKKRSLQEREWFQFADDFLPRGQADPWNQALMDFGALICTQKSPKCEICPVAELCAVNIQAKKNGFQNFHDYLFKHPTSRDSSSPLEILPSKEGREVRKRKDFGLKFEQTDRFFRGRIIDIVRKSSVSVARLEKILNEQFQLKDTVRFQQLLTNLQKEKLITVIEGKVQLAES